VWARNVIVVDHIVRSMLPRTVTVCDDAPTSLPPPPPHSWPMTGSRTLPRYGCVLSGCPPSIEITRHIACPLCVSVVARPGPFVGQDPCWGDGHVIGDWVIHMHMHGGNSVAVGARLCIWRESIL